MYVYQLNLKTTFIIIRHSSRLLLQHIQPTFKFSKLIIVEPMISVEGSHHLHNLRSRLVLSSSRRQNIWPSQEEAYKSLKKGKTRKWDPRVVEAFIVCHFFFRVNSRVCMR